jgi:FKBP-type peptidyl-prolyl cis-trans isomerase FklB
MKYSNIFLFLLIAISLFSIGSCADKKSANESTILNDSTKTGNTKTQSVDISDVNYAMGVLTALSLRDQLGAAESDINAEEISKTTLAFLKGELSEAKTKELSEFSEKEAKRLMELKKSGKPGKMDPKMNLVAGLVFGTNMKRNGINKDKYNKDEFTKGITETIAGKAKFDLNSAQNILQQYFQQAIEASAAKNAADGKKFLEENLKKNPNLKTTASGIQYEILKAGSGEKPKATDKVTTHYRGTLIDGTEFDSSFKRGAPTDFPVNGVIKGWIEILQLMPKGSKWKVYIPSDLAYGPQGSQSGIGPNETLIFELELLKINGK